MYGKKNPSDYNSLKLDEHLLVPKTEPDVNSNNSENSRNYNLRHKRLPVYNSVLNKHKKQFLLNFQIAENQIHLFWKIFFILKILF